MFVKSRKIKWKIVLAVLSALNSYTNFKINLSISSEKLSRILIEIALNLWVNLGRTDIQTILSFTIHEFGLSIYLGLLKFPKE